jgi:serine/threonine protein kinase
MDFSFKEPLPIVDEDEVPDPYAGKYSRQLLVAPEGSLDSSELLDQHYRGQYNNINGEWVFEEREVKLSKEVLGRGNFGEVFVSTWRGSLIACKRLHDSALGPEGQRITVNLKGQTGGNISDGKKIKSLEQQRRDVAANRLQQKELEALTRLRHPNLVQFLGICCHPKDQLQPTMILTELMSYSLYDVLEIRKYELDLVEILDIASDVASGLHYLHGLNPRIVHKNISSKNILFSGRTAKLADFGLSGQDGSKHFDPVVRFDSAGKTVVGARPLTSAAITHTHAHKGNGGTITGTDASSVSVLSFPEAASTGAGAGASAVDEGKEGGRSSTGKGSGLLSTQGDGEVLGGYVDEEPALSMPDVVSASTLPFLAPEIVGGSKYKLTEKIDVYSFGIVLMHMVSGELPSSDWKEREAQLKRITYVEPPGEAEKRRKQQARQEIMQAGTPASSNNNTPQKPSGASAGAAGSPGKSSTGTGSPTKMPLGEVLHQGIKRSSIDPPGITRSAVLSKLISHVTEHMPVDRPTFDGVLSALTDLKFNDRYYPLDRRRPHPQSDLSLGLRRWAKAEAERENEMATLRLHQMRALLQAEGNRWLNEGRLSEFLQEQLESTSSELLSLSKAKNDMEVDLQRTKETLRSTSEDLRLHKERNEAAIRGLLQDKQHLSERVLELDMSLKECISDYHSAYVFCSTFFLSFLVCVCLSPVHLLLPVCIL